MAETKPLTREEAILAMVVEEENALTRLSIGTEYLSSLIMRKPKDKAQLESQIRRNTAARAESVEFIGWLRKQAAL